MQQIQALRELVRRAEDWLRRSDDGNNMVEYLLLCALIAVVAILAISFLGNATSSNFESVGSFST